MSAAPTTEQRLIDLEIKLSYSEDLLDELNKIVARQQQHIDLLLREVASLRHQVADSAPAGFRSLRDELPPHY
jgi:SlyX protein